jgi:hypothetical protein
MRSWNLGLAFGLLSILQALPSTADARVRVAEILYDPEGVDNGAEWVELLNTGDSPVQLGGWLLDASGPNLILPPIELPPGEVLVVHTNAITPQPANGLEIWIVNGSNMGNTSGFVGLWRSETQGLDHIEDWVQYGSTGNSWEGQAIQAGIWPEGGFLPDVEQGHSLRLVDPDAGPAGWVDEPDPIPGSTETALAEPGRLPPHPRLTGAWPNPFNPTSQVGFELPRTARVRLGLHDLLGREVQRLEDGMLAAGLHERTIDLGSGPGGPYFVVLEAEDQRSVLKLLLIR